MIPRRTSRMLIGTCCAVALLYDPAVAQVQPATPSFAAATGEEIFTHDFGTFRQGAAGATTNFSIFNRAAPTGTTSAMTLVDVAPFGYSSQFPLSGTVTSLAAGGQAPMQLGLLTNQYGNLSAQYILKFTSDALPAAPPKYLTITAYAKVLQAGDYDGDGDVDNADYAVWRGSFGAHTTPADGNLNGTVDAPDFVVWRKNFTGPLGSGEAESRSGLSASQAVPEPSSVAFIAAALALAGFARGRARQ